MKFIKKLFKKLLRKNNYPFSDSQKQFAFSAGGTDYYQFADFNNLPALRGMKTMVFYEEMKMKCTAEYLKLHVEAVDNLLTGKTVNINTLIEIKKLNDQMKQRLQIALDIELVYKIASIVFFDSKEDITDYDFAYNRTKILHWKKHDADAFFLREPIIALIPALKDTDTNFPKYLEAVRQLNQLHLENLLQALPPQKTKKLKGSDYFSAVAMPLN